MLVSTKNVSGRSSETPPTSTDLYFPHCIRLPVCGGCCPSPSLRCTPTSTSSTNISVLHLRYSPTARRFALASVLRVPVERHHQCACQCATTAADCRQGQQYRPETCACACLQTAVEKCLQRQQEQQQMRSQMKGQSWGRIFPLRWNGERCTCECRTPPANSMANQIKSNSSISQVSRWHCSTGHRFDGRTCRWDVNFGFYYSLHF